MCFSQPFLLCTKFHLYLTLQEFSALSNAVKNFILSVFFSLCLGGIGFKNQISILQWEVWCFIIYATDAGLCTSNLSKAVLIWFVSTFFALRKVTPGFNTSMCWSAIQRSIKCTTAVGQYLPLFFLFLLLMSSNFNWIQTLNLILKNLVFY